MAIPIIDLFAGPGGLGEGFSRFNEYTSFKIGLSIEKDPYAHQTLTLRSFLRQFLHFSKPLPKEYYLYLNGEISKKDLFDLYPKEYKAAKQEAWCCELGSEKPEFNNDEVDRRIKLALDGEKECVLIGGPPCQAYSLVGRSRMMGGQRNMDGNTSKFENDHRHVLYRQYLRIIAKHEPLVFVMENVKGILSSKLDGELIFPKLLEDLKKPWKASKVYFGGRYKANEYKILSFVTGDEPKNFREYMIRSEEYGVPQARHRVILFGVRKDIYDKNKDKIKKLQSKPVIPVKEILSHLPDLRSGLSKGGDSTERWKSVVTSSLSQVWFTELNEDLQESIKKTVKSIENIDLDRQVSQKYKPTKALNFWYDDEKLKSLSNHDTRGHMDSDIHRYLFCSSFAKVKGHSPRLKDFPQSLLPAHKNVEEGVAGKKFADRFKTQIWDTPSTTITSHISKDGHYFIHPDPTQCRSLTVREAARLQTFPDNYKFEGNRTQQYHQVGNAVPPYLASQLASVITEFLSIYSK